MTKKTSGTSLMPLLAVLGAFLLLGVLMLLLNGQDDSVVQQSDTSATTLQQARSALLVARSALSSAAPDSIESLGQARQSLVRVSVRGLSAEQTKALRNLSSGLETLEKNWRARETLAFAATELKFLLTQLDDAANGLVQVFVFQI